MSNKFSATRALLKRPKVCASKLPRPGGIALASCQISPAEITINTLESVDVTYNFFDQLSPIDSVVDLSYEVNIGTFLGPPSMGNGGNIIANFTADEQTGLALATVKGVSVSSVICVKVSRITILPS